MLHCSRSIYLFYVKCKEFRNKKRPVSKKCTENKYDQDKTIIIKKMYKKYKWKEQIPMSEKYAKFNPCPWKNAAFFLFLFLF